MLNKVVKLEAAQIGAESAAGSGCAGYSTQILLGGLERLNEASSSISRVASHVLRRYAGGERGCKCGQDRELHAGTKDVFWM